MIVAETGAGYRFVTQPDHAELAGQFADHWGNDAFERPEPTAAVRLAAYTHDDGWWRYDRRPHLDDDGTPVDFTDLPAETWIDLYDEGIDGVVDLDPYAGLLVSMHGTGLRRQRYGLSPSWPSLGPTFADFVDRQEERQRWIARDLLDDGRLSEADTSLLSALHETGAAPGGHDGRGRRTYESRLWSNYELLQAWDTLSLSFCTTTSPPGYDEVGPVPTTRSGVDETLAIDRLDRDEYRVEPYPFDSSPLDVSVPARTVSGEALDGDERLVRAYYGSKRETETFRLRGGERSS